MDVDVVLVVVALVAQLSPLLLLLLVAAAGLLAFIVMHHHSIGILRSNSIQLVNVHVVCIFLLVLWLHSHECVVHGLVACERILIKLVLSVARVPLHQVYYPRQQDRRSLRYLTQILKFINNYILTYIWGELFLVLVEYFDESFDEALLDLAYVHEHELHLEGHGGHHLAGHGPVGGHTAPQDAHHVEHFLDQGVRLDDALQLYDVGLSQPPD